MKSKIYNKKLIIHFILLIIPVLLLGQAQKREMRAVWVATVDNIDWPSEIGLSAETMQKEIINTLNLHKENNLNAVILQVRPTADAIYPSKLEPWSKYLTGKQGLAPEPFFDPLKFWVEEAHLRGMELHAWFNPYRIKINNEDTLDNKHIANLNPEWCWQYGNKMYFEPGNPYVWEYLIKVVSEVVERYDVDAVHFDDYFYPYKIKGEEIPDSAAFKNFGGKYYPDNIQDWRRSNVDTIIQLLNQNIKSIKPWVQFGISPFGVWRNRSDDPLGSETTAGTSNYDGLYADVIKWQREGWIDYLMPQLYWRDDHPAVGFSNLAYWWADYSYSRNMYVGLAPYRINKKSKYKLWKKDKYLLIQIELLRELDEINGFAFFSSKHFFRKDLKGLNKKMSEKYCQLPALPPRAKWIDDLPPKAPGNVTLHGDTLRWDEPIRNDKLDEAKFYIVYKYPIDEKKFLKEPAKIVSISNRSEYVIQKSNETGIYRISTIDRSNNESLLSEPVLIKQK